MLYEFIFYVYVCVCVCLECPNICLRNPSQSYLRISCAFPMLKQQQVCASHVYTLIHVPSIRNPLTYIQNMIKKKGKMKSKPNEIHSLRAQLNVSLKARLKCDSHSSIFLFTPHTGGMTSPPPTTPPCLALQPPLVRALFALCHLFCRRFLCDFNVKCDTSLGFFIPFDH